MKSEEIYKCFEFSEESKTHHHTKCIICNKKLTSKFVYYLKRHIISCHHDYAVNICLLIQNEENEPKKKKKIWIHMDDNTFLKACVKLTTQFAV